MHIAKKNIRLQIKPLQDKYQSAICLLIGIAVIVFFGMYNISNNTSLKIVGDEFGYWTAGATFAGIDWSSVASYNSFYGYGYGIILAPILKLGITQTLKYQIAIVINVFMLVSLYSLIYYIIRNTKQRPLIAAFISLTGTLYSSNLVYSQYTLAETFILFLYVLSVITFIAFLKKQKTIFSILLPVINGLLLAVHTRTIALFPAMIVVFVVYCIIKKKYRALISHLVATFIVFICYFIITNWYQETIHSISNVNGASGQIKKITQLFTIKGISLFAIGFLGKTAYSVMASFSIVLIAFIRVVKNSFSEIKARKLRPITILGLYLFINLIALEAISALFHIDYRSRFDLLTYGRYHDFTICAIIVYELYLGLAKREQLSFPQYLLSGFGVIFLAVISLHFLPNLQATGHLSVFSPGIAFFLKSNNILFLLILCLIILVVYYYVSIDSIVFRKGKSHQTIVIALILISLFVFMSDSSLSSTYSWSVEGCSNEERLAQKIQENYSDKSLLYYTGDSWIDIDFLQFLLNDKSITCFDDTSILSELDENDLVLTTINSRLITDEWYNRYDLLDRSSYLRLWRKKSTIL